MMFYMTIYHHSTMSRWYKCKAHSLRGAKREASREFGGGYIGHQIRVVEVPDGYGDEINRLPYWRKTIV